MAKAIIRTAKLSTNGNIGASLSHNYRDRKTLNANEMKTHLNYHQLPDKDSAYNAIQNRLPEKIRKNGVRCIEYLITASPEFFKESSQETQDAYFEASVNWLVERHGIENVVTMSIHNDETSPHLIAYVVPMVWNEKKQEETLNAKHFLGGRQKLSEMQTDFHKSVQQFGLERGVERSVANHKTIKEFYGLMNNPIPNFEVVADKVKEQSHDIRKGLVEGLNDYRERIAEVSLSESLNQLETGFIKGKLKPYSLLEQELLSLKAKNKELAKENDELKSECTQVRTKAKIDVLEAKEKVHEAVAQAVAEVKGSNAYELGEKVMSLSLQDLKAVYKLIDEQTTVNQNQRKGIPM